MNLKQLEMFVQVSRLGSFSRAATALGMAQSLISRSIGLLEADWGDRLFERTGRGVHLTEFGCRMISHAETLLLQSAKLNDEVRGASGVISGTVRIGILPSLTAKIIPPLFADVCEKAPGIKLQIVESLNGTLDNQLSSGELDLAITNRHGLCSKEDTLGILKTYLISRTGHETTRRSTIPFAKLAQLPLVLPVRPSALRTILDHHAKRLGINLNIVLEVESLAAMIEVTMTGKAMTILPHYGIEHELTGGRLSASQIINPALPRLIKLVTTVEHPLSRAARFVHSRIKELAPSLLKSEIAETMTASRQPARQRLGSVATC